MPSGERNNDEVLLLKDATVPDHRSSSIDLYTPLHIALVWLLGTYALFLTVGQVGLVDNPVQLTLFVLAASGAFAAGYLVKTRVLKTIHAPVPEMTDRRVKRLRLVTAGSGLYFLVYGFAMLAEYGVGDPSQILSALGDPGSAYLAKFDVYTRQVATGAANPVIQVLTLMAVLGTPLVPFLVVHFSRLTADVRIIAVLGLSVYTLFFLSIGTLSGLGNLLIFGTVAHLVAKARRRLGGRRRRWPTAVLLLAAVLFAGYMAYNQSSRLEATGANHKFEPNQLVASIAGDEFARGVTVAAFYPTHGYQGLAYNLETPFMWTHGLGASRALDSYWSQYGLGDGVAGETYPARTEMRTGWPADSYWATIYPWLASDLTFPGTVLFMAALGWWLARFWFEAVVLDDSLALLLLSQLAVLIAFIPANNQLGISRSSVIAAASLLSLYALKRLQQHLPFSAHRAL